MRGKSGDLSQTTITDNYHRQLPKPNRQQTSGETAYIYFEVFRKRRIAKEKGYQKEAEEVAWSSA